MKKIAGILVFVFAFTLSAQAQKKGIQKRAEKIMVKITKDLDLTEDQEEKMRPIVIAQMKDRKKMRDLKKENSATKPSKEERKQMRQERQQKQQAVNKQIADILDETQMEKYKKMQDEMKKKAKKKKQ